MAKAKAKSEIKKVVTGITLELTLEEAMALYVVSEHTAGDPKSTFRGEIDSVGRALNEAGMRFETRNLCHVNRDSFWMSEISDEEKENLVKEVTGRIK